MMSKEQKNFTDKHDDQTIVVFVTQLRSAT